MDMVVIPFNFEKLSPAEQEKVVPICVTRKDRHGNNIAWGWFEAVSKIQGPLKSLAQRFLYDVWRTSEIADLAVQSVGSHTARISGAGPNGGSMFKQNGALKIYRRERSEKGVARQLP